MSETVTMQVELKLTRPKINWQAFTELAEVSEWSKLPDEVRAERFYPPDDVRLMTQYLLLSYLYNNSGHEGGAAEITDRLTYLYGDDMKSVGLDERIVKLEISRMNGSLLGVNIANGNLRILDSAKAMDILTSVDEQLMASSSELR